MATPVKKPSQKFSVNRRPSGECDDGRKDHPTSGGFLSNDGFLWTDTNPDLKLIEPRILVSVNYNYLEFSRKAQRPPERRTISLINHGDHPVAFQVQTTDNYSYFVDRRHGIIPPRQCSVNAIVKMANASVIHVHRRPHQEYPAENRAEFYNVPHKDKMVILLAPQICQTFAPEAMFHYERCHEKLKIMLRYTGIEAKPGADNPKQQLLHIVPGWCTWQEGTGLGENIRNKNAARQLAKFKKQEATLNRTASREQCEEEEKKRPKLKKVATPTKKPAILPAPDAPPEAAKKKEGGGVIMKMLKNLNPFGKDDHPLPRSPKKIQTPEKADNDKDHQQAAANDAWQHQETKDQLK
uniref:Major sperm protein n=1 Tax=Caenorhabditis japonica TaxID=281687 RepID=A0A8R1HHH1_CAEJA